MSDIQQLDFTIPELQMMKKYPKEIFYIGNLELLKRKKVSIVGSRRPSSYTKQYTHYLAKHVIYKNKLNSTINYLTELIMLYLFIFLLK